MPNAQRPVIAGSSVLITGASSGIGRELARQFAAEAGTLVLVARRVERLEQLREELDERHPSLGIHVVPCDLADAAATEQMVARVGREVGRVDILVNNAGLGYHALYDRADWSRVHRVIQVNVVALALLTQRLLPPMVERGQGGILNVGSGAGWVLMPGSAVYAGTKHFVDGFTETLRLELEGTGVAVTQVLPGPVETEFGEAAGAEVLIGEPPRFMRISAERCAREAFEGFRRGRALVFPGRAYRWLMRTVDVMPRAMMRQRVRRAARRLRRS